MKRKILKINFMKIKEMIMSYFYRAVHDKQDFSLNYEALYKKKKIK